MVAAAEYPADSIEGQDVPMAEAGVTEEVGDDEQVLQAVVEEMYERYSDGQIKMLMQVVKAAVEGRDLDGLEVNINGSGAGEERNGGSG